MSGVRCSRAGLALVGSLALVAGSVAAWTVRSPVAAGETAVGVVSTCTDPSISDPYGIAAGPDGALWFTNNTNNSIGRITTDGVVTNFTGAGISGPTDIATGSDGALWFTNGGNNSIGRIGTDGVVSNFVDPSIAAPRAIVAGSDGALWFINYDTKTIGRITTGGAVSQYPGPGAGLPQAMAAGPDSALWFTVGGSNDSIGRITTTGAVSSYTSAAIASPQGITSGPDGAMWFDITGYSGSIGRITTGGDVSAYEGSGGGWRIAAGPDGALWFTEGGAIGRITTDGTRSSSGLPSGSSALFGIVAGSDGAMWFTASGSNSIGRITTGVSTGSVNCPVAGGGGGGGGGSTTGGSTTTTTGGTTTGGTTTGGTTLGPKPVTRLAGADRIATAVAVSPASFPDARSAGAVVLARSDNFADALAGTPLAAAKSGPLLLNPPFGGLDGRVETEIARVLPPGGTVWVLGGAAALSTIVDAQLQADGYRVARVAGRDRYATAVAVAHQGLGDPPTVLEATGLNFPDALAGGAAAAKAHAAVLLTAGVVMPTSTAAYLRAHPGDTRYALGGPAAAADPSATSIVGADRYGTATAVANGFFSAPTAIGAASGTTFPDALAGGANAVRAGGPLLLVDPSGPLPASVQSYLADNATSLAQGWLYGGASAVGDDVLMEIRQAISR